VLLVDDEPNIRRFLRAGFELEGYVVLEAANAADAFGSQRSILQTSSFST
jgi:two-component system KDP operon response regulator KdpE